MPDSAHPTSPRVQPDTPTLGHAHASGSFLAQTCASDGTRFLRGEYEEHDDSWESSATHVVDWAVEPPAAIGPGTSAPVDSHGRTGSLRRSQELLPREY